LEDSAKISARMEINMGKTVFMFPGQGAQYIGMAKDFYDAIPECREVFEEASEASGLDIAALCFEENDKINITEYTQICMLTAEAAILRALEVKGYKADVTAGLSLGEYGALIACGALSRKDAFALVRKRGIYMQEAVPEGGAMAAVLALDTAQIEEACKKTEGIVSIANYNCPGQIVITGEEKAVAAAGALQRSRSKTCCSVKGQRTVPLSNVKGCRRKTWRGIKTCNSPYTGNPVCRKRDSRLCDKRRGDQTITGKTGVLICPLAADDRASDRRRSRQICRDRTGENLDRIHAQDQP